MISLRRHSRTAFLACLALAGLPACGGGGDDGTLFDGHSLEGWSKVGGGASYRLEDETLLGEVGPGANTFLRTDRVFADFDLSLQMLVEQPGNSGIQFRSFQREGDGVVTGTQFEIDPTARGFSGGLYDEARRGWLFSPSPPTALRVGEWNDIRIEARGPRLRTWLNAAEVSDLLDPTTLEGFVALQVHAGDTGVFRWRDIEIEELGPARSWQTLFGGEGLVGMEPSGEWRVGNGKIEGRAEADAEARLTTFAALDDFALRLRWNPEQGHARLLLRDETLSVELGPGARSGAVADPRTGATLALAPAELLDELAAADGPVEVTVTLLGDRVAVQLDGNPALDLTLDDLGASGPAALVLPPGASGRIEALELVRFGPERKDGVLPPGLAALPVPPAPVLDPEQARASFRIAPGYRVEAVATEPLVEDPVAIDWDEAGHLYVVEMRGFMPDLEANGEDAPVGRVVRLSDDDGDGRFDTRTVFLDGLVLPRAVRVLPDGVWIGEPPHLWRCRDTVGDGVCDSKERMGDYGVDEENVEHSENGLLYGLDGRLYNARSSRAFHWPGAEAAVEPTLFRGQWGIDQDDWGRMFYNTNSNFLLVDVLPADYLLRHPATDPRFRRSRLVSLDLARDEWVYPIRVSLGANRAYLEGTLRRDGRVARPTGASGIAVLRSDAFGAEARGDVFVPETVGHVVARFRVNAAGDLLESEHLLTPDPDWGQREFLASSDERFRPVSVAVGPDGNLYVVDMYRGLIQHKAFVSDYLDGYVRRQGLEEPLGLGRIWRVVREGVEPTLPPVDLEAASSAERVRVLSHPVGVWRDRAQRHLIVSRDPTAIAPLRDLAAHSAVGRVHALHTLAALGALDPGTLALALADPEPQVQMAALRAAEGSLIQDPDGLLPLLRERVDARPWVVRIQLAFSLGSLSGHSEARIWLAELLESDPGDPALQEAVLSGLSGVEVEFVQLLMSRSFWSEPSPERSQWLATLGGAVFLRLARADATDPQVGQQRESLFAALAQLPKSGSDAWITEALLRGAAEAVREPGTPLVILDGPPELFQSETGGWSEEILTAVARVRRGVTWPGDDQVPGAVPLTPEQKVGLQLGAVYYEAACATCHQSHGRGQTGLAPSLVGSPWVLDADAWLVGIALQGLTGPVVIAGETWNQTMPGHAADPRLDDATLAGLGTYLRRAWGHAEAAVEPDAVALLRTETADRAEPWTTAELLALDVDHRLDRYVGKYTVAGQPFSVSVRRVGGELLLKVPLRGESALSVGEDGGFFARNGSEQIGVAFREGDEGVEALLIDWGGQKIRFERKP